MADIRPFAALRPAPGKESVIAALPYDVYNRAEACLEVSKHPDSFLSIDRAETQFPESVGMYEDCVYEKAAELLHSRTEAGDFVQDEKPCYYLYEQNMTGRVQTGIVAVASIDDYLNGVIKKHENTRKDKLIDRIRHVDACNAQTGPIFLCYRDDEKINSIVEKVKKNAPYASFISEGEIANRLWKIDDPGDIRALTQAFAGIENIYIADGHHRCASAVEVGLKRREQHPDYTGSEEFNYFLSVLFPKSQLMIMDYNRFVRDLNGCSVHEFLTELNDVFLMETKGKTPVKPAAKGEFGMYLNGCWYRLRVKDRFKSADPVEGLDVSILQEYVLQPILGIEDPRTDPRIDFIGGIRGLEELERRVDRCNAEASAGSAMQHNAANSPADASAMPGTASVAPKAANSAGDTSAKSDTAHSENNAADLVARTASIHAGESAERRTVPAPGPTTMDAAGNAAGPTALDEAGHAAGPAVAFSMYPTSMDELLAVADAGRLVPPKSTWFEPKLLSGLFIHLLR